MSHFIVSDIVATRRVVTLHLCNMGWSWQRVSLFVMVVRRRLELFGGGSRLRPDRILTIVQVAMGRVLSRSQDEHQMYLPKSRVY